MVIGTLRLLPAPHRRMEVLEILRCLRGPVLSEPSCEAFHVYEEQEPDPAIVLVERWHSKAALEAHIRSDAFRSILGALELSQSPPEVRFYHVSASEGMEAIARGRARSKGDVT